MATVTEHTPAIDALRVALISNTFKWAFAVVMVLLFVFAWLWWKTPASTTPPPSKMASRHAHIPGSPMVWGGNGDAGKGGSISRDTTMRMTAPFMPPAGSKDNLSGQPADDYFRNAMGDSYLSKPSTAKIDCRGMDVRGWDKDALEEIQALTRLGAVDERDRDVVIRDNAIDTTYGKGGRGLIQHSANAP